MSYAKQIKAHQFELQIAKKTMVALKRLEMHAEIQVLGKCMEEDIARIAELEEKIANSSKISAKG